MWASFIVNPSGDIRPLRDVIADLIDFCTPFADSIGESRGLAIARKILAAGAGYSAQLETYRDGHSARAVA